MAKHNDTGKLSVCMDEGAGNRGGRGHSNSDMYKEEEVDLLSALWMTLSIAFVMNDLQTHRGGVKDVSESFSSSYNGRHDGSLWELTSTELFARPATEYGRYGWLAMLQTRTLDVRLICVCDDRFWTS